MSGPIVRTGTNPKFWSNWDQAFGKKSGSQNDGLQAEADKRVKKAAKAVDAANKAAMTKKAVKKAAVKPAVAKTATRKKAAKKA